VLAAICYWPSGRNHSPWVLDSGQGVRCNCSSSYSIRIGQRIAVEEGVPVEAAGSTTCFLRTVWVLLASSEQGLQHTLDGFIAACDYARMKLGTWTTRCYVSPETQVSVRRKQGAIDCSRPSSSSTLRWYSVFTSGGRQNKSLSYGLVNQTQHCVSFIDQLSQNGSFQTRQSSQFLNRSLFRSSPMVMSLGLRPKECYQKYKRQRWDFCEEFRAWHFEPKCTYVEFVKPWISS